MKIAIRGPARRYAMTTMTNHHHRPRCLDEHDLEAVKNCADCTRHAFKNVTEVEGQPVKATIEPLGDWREVFLVDRKFRYRDLTTEQTVRQLR